MSSLLHWMTVAGCIGLFLAFMCRLKELSVWSARLDYVFFHVIWLAYSGWVLYAALVEQRELSFELLPLIGSALWLHISWYTWRQRNGPPRHVLRARALRELDDEDLRQVAGGVKR